MLEHHGLNRCMDKGLHSFKRCVGLSILAYNLHILGNALRAIDRKKKSKPKSSINDTGQQPKLYQDTTKK